MTMRTSLAGTNLEGTYLDGTRLGDTHRPNWPVENSSLQSTVTTGPILFNHK